MIFRPRIPCASRGGPAPRLRRRHRKRTEPCPTVTGTVSHQWARQARNRVSAGNSAENQYRAGHLADALTVFANTGEALSEEFGVPGRRESPVEESITSRASRQAEADRRSRAALSSTLRIQDVYGQVVESTHDCPGSCSQAARRLRVVGRGTELPASCRDVAHGLPARSTVSRRAGRCAPPADALRGYRYFSFRTTTAIPRQPATSSTVRHCTAASNRPR